MVKVMTTPDDILLDLYTVHISLEQRRIRGETWIAFFVLSSRRMHIVLTNDLLTRMHRQGNQSRY